jgi:hypothetical protein
VPVEGCKVDRLPLVGQQCPDVAPPCAGPEVGAVAAWLGQGGHIVRGVVASLSADQMGTLAPPHAVPSAPKALMMRSAASTHICANAVDVFP